MNLIPANELYNKIANFHQFCACYPLISDSRWGISKHTFNSSIGLFEYYIYECTIGAPDDPDIVPKEVESRTPATQMPENDIFSTFSDELF